MAFSISKQLADYNNLNLRLSVEKTEHDDLKEKYKLMQRELNAIKELTSNNLFGDNFDSDDSDISFENRVLKSIKAGDTISGNNTSPTIVSTVGPRDEESLIHEIEYYKNELEKYKREYENIRSFNVKLLIERDNSLAQTRVSNDEVERFKIVIRDLSEKNNENLIIIDDLKSRVNNSHIELTNCSQQIQSLNQRIDTATEELETSKRMYIDKTQALNEQYDILHEQYVQIVNVNDKNVSDIQNIIEFISKQFNLHYVTSFETLMEQLKTFIEANRRLIVNYQMQIADMKLSIEDLDMTTEEKSRRLNDTLNKINSGVSIELEKLDTEAIMYNDTNEYFKTNPLKLDDFVSVYNYNTSPNNVNYEFIPFLQYISSVILSDVGENMSDFADNTELDVNMYHAYILLILKLVGLFSKRYIRNYIDYVYDECKKSKQQSIDLPKLILPQSFQTNSLYYLMNRFNSKIYEPDRVTDFSNFIYNFLKPEFSVDSTQALNLFQPDIGKRYNSIMIYSEDTANILEKLRNSLYTTKGNN